MEFLSRAGWESLFLQDIGIKETKLFSCDFLLIHISFEGFSSILTEIECAFRECIFRVILASKKVKFTLIYSILIEVGERM